MKVPRESSTRKRGKSVIGQASRGDHPSYFSLSLSFLFLSLPFRHKPENISVTVTRGMFACRESETTGQ